MLLPTTTTYYVSPKLVEAIVLEQGPTDTHLDSHPV